MTQEALKLAFEALETLMIERRSIYDKAITAIKEALARTQEPVAWMFQHDETGRMNYVSNDGIHNPTMFLEMNPRYALVCPLYTTPPQRTWVGLTDEEMLECNMDGDWTTDRETAKLNVQAKLKEKNT